MKNKLIYTIFIILIFGFVNLGKAQEIQVAFDNDGKINDIDLKAEQTLNLFPNYPNFKKALLFQVTDSTFVLEIYYRKNQKIYKVRKPFNAQEVMELRQKVTKRFKVNKPKVVLDQEGRTKLIGGCLSLSLFYYGWAIPSALDVNDGKLAVGLYMLTGGAGYFLPFYTTRNMRVSDAAATLFLYGGTRGIAHGIILSYLLSDDPGRASLAAGIGVSLAEAFVGFHWANTSDMSAGTAEVIGTGGDFGLGLGFGTSVLLDSKRVGSTASLLLGSGVGLVAGKMLSESQDYSRGDAQVLKGSGLLGAYLPLALVDMANPDNVRIYAAASMVGSVLGLGRGQKLVKGKDFSTGQGYLIELSGFAGGLLGLGVAYLISPEDEFNSTLFLSSSALGATGGFWLMYHYYAPKAETVSQTGNWNLSIRPEGLLALTMGKKINRELQKHLRLISFDYRF